MKSVKKSEITKKSPRQTPEAEIGKEIRNQVEIMKKSEIIDKKLVISKSRTRFYPVSDPSATTDAHRR